MARTPPAAVTWHRRAAADVGTTRTRRPASITAVRSAVTPPRATSWVRNRIVVASSALSSASIHDRGREDRVQRGRDLVAHEDRRFGDEGPGDRRPLQLAAA